MDNETDKMYRRNKLRRILWNVYNTSYIIVQYVLLWTLGWYTTPGKYLINIWKDLQYSYYNQSQIRQMIREVYVKYIPLGSSL